MIKELEELKIDRMIAAKVCGLTLNELRTKYLKTVNDDEHCPERFFCNVKDWKPDEDWNHFMFMRNSVPSPDFFVMYEDKPKDSFKSFIIYIKS
tara:strand:+ start:39220 stop:39501 length:282 start_codon:yes stop_codon:yes gene_type:complete